MGPLVLAKNFLVAAHAGQVFLSDWSSFAGEFENATVHVHCQTISPSAGLSTGFRVRVRGSFDTVESYGLGGSINVTAVGSQANSLHSLGPLVRLEIENTEAVALVAIVSVWVQVKAT